ncbi:MAG: hypothetical protein AAF648_16065 [Pseudomonadota bacterium]
MGIRLCICIAALLGAASSMQALAVGCTDRLPGRIIGREGTLEPVATYADELIAGSLAAAAPLKDPLAAIYRLQEYLYSLRHPEIDKSRGVFRLRCAGRSKYDRLQSAIDTRIDQLTETYRSNQWFIGNGDVSTLRDPATARTQPGLLELLLMTDRYDDFEREATAFLTSDAALNDRTAPKLFERIEIMIQHRQRELAGYRENYETLGQSLVGLTTRESQGITRLPGLAERISALRTQHVAHWLSKEAESFEVVRAAAPRSTALFDLGLELETARTQLRNAMRVAGTEDDARLKALARDRANALLTLERPGDAAEYFELAGLREQAEQAQADAQNRAERQSERLQQAAEETLLELQKTDAERAAFNQETDALADELGIDLDDF